MLIVEISNKRNEINRLKKLINRYEKINLKRKNMFSIYFFSSLIVYIMLMFFLSTVKIENLELSTPMLSVMTFILTSLYLLFMLFIATKSDKPLTKIEKTQKKIEKIKKEEHDIEQNMEILFEELKELNNTNNLNSINEDLIQEILEKKASKNSISERIENAEIKENFSNYNKIINM